MFYDKLSGVLMILTSAGIRSSAECSRLGQYATRMESCRVRGWWSRQCTEPIRTDEIVCSTVNNSLWLT
uniref:Putative ovule protein n=1 Tax=Solanum chacoense TaxID=4108 RepID=A0A0V0HVQ5_SOLCH